MRKAAGGSNGSAGERSVIQWRDRRSFVIDDVTFTLDYEHGGSRRPSTLNDFTIMKSPSFIGEYEALADKDIRTVLELGVYQGGSFVFLDKLFRPSVLSAIELEPGGVAALDQYVSENGDRCRVHYGVSQGDVQVLSAIVERDFGGEIDLVVDDASHFYDLTKRSFLMLFPALRLGGTYVIEDWAWSFHDAFQDPNDPWFGQASLANILIDLAEELALRGAIEKVCVSHNMIVITKASQEAINPLFAGHGRRGRTAGSI